MGSSPDSLEVSPLHGSQRLVWLKNTKSVIVLDISTALPIYMLASSLIL